MENLHKEFLLIPSIKKELEEKPLFLDTYEHIIPPLTFSLLQELRRYILIIDTIFENLENI